MSARKLTNDQAAEIRHRAAEGEKRKVLAAEFGVSLSTVNSIIARRYYGTKTTTYGFVHPTKEKP